MARRKKVYTGSSTPRYKMKMYRLHSMGGQIPLVVALPVVEAMTAEWSNKFGKFQGFRRNDVMTACDSAGVPNIFRGVVQGLCMKIKAELDRRKTKDPAVIEELIEREVRDHGLAGYGAIVDAIRMAFGLQPKGEEEVKKGGYAG